MIDDHRNLDTTDEPHLEDVEEETPPPDPEIDNPQAELSEARMKMLRLRLAALDEQAMRAGHQAARLWAWNMPDDARDQELREARADYEAAVVRAELEALERPGGPEPALEASPSPPERAPAHPAVLTIADAARLLRRRRGPAKRWLRERGLIVDVAGEPRVLRAALEAAMNPARVALTTARRSAGRPARADDQLFVLAPR